MCIMAKGNSVKGFLLFILLVASTGLQAAPAWYLGEITRVWHYGSDGFIVTLDSGVLSDCKHTYAYFKASEIGEAQEKALYSLALSAFHARANPDFS